MQGRSVTKAQKIYWDNLVQVVGCIACRKELNYNNYCLIHHIDGRTKKLAHWLVLPLCADHHQDRGTAIAVHPYKFQFERKYGTQLQLIADCIEILQNARITIPVPVVDFLKNNKLIKAG